MKYSKEQQEAINTIDGQVCIISVAGSGKTSVIVARANNIIKSGVRPYRILVLTFSKAAAVQMADRYKMQYGSDVIRFSTIHSLCYSVLARAYNLKAEDILSEAGRLKFFTEFHRQLLYKRVSGVPDDFDEYYRKCNEYINSMAVGTADNQESKSSSKAYLEITFSQYKEFKKNNKKLDFDDMLLSCYELLRKRKDILAAWQKKFRYILVDEFQDINHLQYDIVKMLAAPENNLFVVGDDDQSIYHFRGARPEIMLNFPEDFKNAETVLLNINYRCSGNILNTAMKVIDHNENRYVKKLSTPNNLGEPVEVKEFKNPRDEYMTAAGILKDRMEKGEYIEDTAFLFRTNQEAEGLVAALMEYGVPFTMKEKLPNLFRHWICKNMIAYLKMAQGDRSRSTFLEIMNRPNRYIAREALAEKNIDFKALAEFYKDKDWMCDRITTLETHLRILKTMAPYAAINFIRNGMGYEEYLQEYARYRKIKPEELWETLNRIHESARGMKTLEDWLAYMDEYTRKLEEQAKKQDVKREGCVISTLHAVKGLEYDRVYIMNVNEGSMPYRKAVLEAHLEEERRLFYVGMTRAKKKLCLCYVRMQYEKEREPSRFLEEAGL